jgi:lipopolysaccharide export LptBFGC system permease protein LptF
VGRRVAQASWLVVWLSLATLALLPAGRTIADTTPGEPAWLAWTDAHLATALTRHGLLAAVVLAVVFVVVASGTFLPRRAARAAIVLAVAVAAALWLAQGLGGILTGSATDPDTGPLLALLALAFWPLASSTGET